jgi:hypothetical protein
MKGVLKALIDMKKQYNTDVFVVKIRGKRSGLTYYKCMLWHSFRKMLFIL